MVARIIRTIRSVPLRRLRATTGGRSRTSGTSRSVYLNLAAYEWYNLERYAVAKHGEALPLGIMTQVFACQQHPADQTCKSTDLPACQAYAMMTKLLNGSHETARPIAFVTDIGYER